MAEEYVLELEHLRKEYPSSVVLKDFSVRLKKGEILGLVGENGAGKSTLVKCCSGAINATSGIIRINGKECSELTPKKASALGISVIYQEFTNVPELSVVENVFLGHPIRKGPLIDRQAMVREVREIFDWLKVDIDPNEQLKNLSVGFQQMVEIAKAIRQNTQILFMDEPSAPLTNNEVDNLFRIVRLLQEKGITIIYITHRLKEILQLTDRIAVLRDGYQIDTLQTSETSIPQLIRLMVGREMNQTYPLRSSCVAYDRPVLELEHLTGNGDRDISLTLHAGEVLGGGGLVGSGRTELLQMIFGAKPKESGRILLNGSEIAPKSPQEAIRLGIAFVPEDRKRFGALMHRPIRDNINMAVYRSISRYGVIRTGDERNNAEKYREELKIRCRSVLREVGSMSGGNQQKVILGKWLAADSQVFLLDEPTRGIDVGAKYEIYKLVNALVEQGKSVLMVSSEMEELMGMSDRIIVLSEHRISGTLERNEFDADRIMFYASGFSVNEEEHV